LAAAGSQPPVSGLTSAEAQGSFSGIDPAEYIRRARQEYDAGRIASGLAILDNFSVEYPSWTDEALWLYGQMLEANGPSRDIRLALEYYRRLVREFPQSPLVVEAQRRISYLERFYFNIQ
jgi:outer membrane protein assembly factor BamD (BamD/ComL family)